MLKKLMLTALVAVTLCGVRSVQAQAAPGDFPARRFGDIIGVNTKFAQGEPQKDLPLLKELGVRWVRDNVSWPEVEPVAGQYAPFSAAFQERLKFYKDNNISVCFMLAYENSKAYPTTPDNPLNPINAEAFGRYAAEAARQMKAAGVRFVLEIWNEPHNFVLKKMVGGEWNGKLPSPWVDHYIKMVEAAVKQVKAFDPQIRLLDDDDMWIIHYWYLEKGLPKDLDGFAFHPYAGASDGPEMCAVGQDTGWAKPFVMTDADRSLQSAVRRLREQAVTKMGKLPALWATEWGWAVGDKAPYTLLTPEGKMTEEAVAAYLPRAFITAAAAGVETVLWFSSFDGPDGPMGLRSNDGKQRPAFGAFRTMSAELGTWIMQRQLIGADHRTSGVQAYLFYEFEGQKIVLWDIDGEAEFVVNGKVEPGLYIRDVQGNVVTTQKAKDGRWHLKLGQSPIYVEGLGSDMTLEPVLPAVPTAPTFLF